MAPTVTVAIPLHGSARWVDNVVANVRALPPMVTEIIISDQTCIDDAADQLRSRLANDRRVVIRAEPAGLSFADHYQQLLEMGSGELFMWMPHDDIFAPDWVPILATALASHPQAWLAFGRVRNVEIDGFTPVYSQRFPFRPGMIVGWTAIRMMVTGASWVPFRGLLRRRMVLAAGLSLDPATVVLTIDNDWVFAVALQSALVYDDRAVTWKRRYDGSTHTSPLWQSQRRGDPTQAAVALLNRHGPQGATGVAVRCHARLIGLRPRARTWIGRLAPAWVKPPIRQVRNWFARR